MNDPLQWLKKQWNQRTLREQVLLVAFLFLLTTYVVGNFLIIPAKRQYNTLKAELTTLPTKEELNDLYRQQQEVEKQIKQVLDELPFVVADDDGKERLVAFQAQMRKDKILLLEEISGAPQDTEIAEFPYEYPFHMIYHIPPGQLMTVYQERRSFFPEISTKDLDLVWGEDGWIRVEENLALLSEKPLTQYAMTSFTSLGKPAITEEEDGQETGQLQEDVLAANDSPRLFSESAVTEETTNDTLHSETESIHETMVDLDQLRYYVNHEASTVHVVDEQEGIVNYRLISRNVPGQLNISLPWLKSDLSSNLMVEIQTQNPLKGQIYVGLVDSRGTAVRKVLERSEQTWSVEIPAGYQLRALIYELEIGEGEENQWAINKISLQQ